MSSRTSREGRVPDLDLTVEESSALDLARELSARVRAARQDVQDLRACLEAGPDAAAAGDVALVHQLPGLRARVTLLADGTVRCAPEGELDVGNAEQLAQVLQDTHAPGRDVVLDLAGVPFLDSAALGVVLRARRRAAQHGDTLVLCCPTRPVTRLLAITRLDHLLVAV